MIVRLYLYFICSFSFLGKAGASGSQQTHIGQLPSEVLNYILKVCPSMRLDV